MENNRFLTIILTVVITAVVVGGGVYWWQSSQFSRQTKDVESTTEQAQQATQNDTRKTSRTEPSATKTQTTQKLGTDIFAKIKQELADGEGLSPPTTKPSFPLPNDIHEAQIDNYYLLGDVFVALVRRSSMNVWLKDLPAGFDASFAGIIAADNVKQKWEKILTIQDISYTVESSSYPQYPKNNPYAIWTDGGYKTPQRSLFLTIVDQNGAGSGEGFMKLLTSSDAKQWSQEQCYYFDAHVQGENYFLSTATEISEGGSGFEKYSGKECNNFHLLTE